MRLGDVEFHIVSDGQFQIDGGGVFGVVPRVLWERVIPPDDLNRVPGALHCLLILSAGKRILVDCGYGDKLSPKEIEIQGLRREQGGLLDSLRRLGYAPGDIDIVINTHLHADHSGGNTVLSQGVLHPTFPKAEYCFQRLEWADACFPNERTCHTYLPENLLPLNEAHQLRLLNGETRLTEHVRCVVTRGHTRAHQIVVIESGDESVAFLGDLASRAVQMERLGWISSFDSEPLETLETKRAVRDWAVEKHALCIFEHDVTTPLGYIVREGERFRVRGI